MNENIETMEKDFILYWRHGDLTHVKGTTIDSAFTQAGYGAGAMGALDFYMEEKKNPAMFITKQRIVGTKKKI